MLTKIHGFKYCQRLKGCAPHSVLVEKRGHYSAMVALKNSFMLFDMIKKMPPLGSQRRQDNFDQTLKFAE